MVSQAEQLQQQQEQQRRLQRQIDVRRQQQILQQGSAFVQQEAEKKAQAESKKLQEAQQAQLTEQAKAQAEFEAKRERVVAVNAAIEEIDDLHETRGEAGNFDRILRKYGREVFDEANSIFRSNIRRGAGSVGIDLPKAPTTVFFGGQGFSVAPELQETFIREQTERADARKVLTVQQPKQFDFGGGIADTFKPPVQLPPTTPTQKQPEVFVPGFGGGTGAFFTPSQFGGSSVIRQPTEKELKDKGIIKVEPPPSTIFFGGQQFGVLPPLSPLRETTTDVPTVRLEVSDIKPDNRRGLIRRAEELIPIAGIPLTTLSEPIYLPDSDSIRQFNKLIGNRGIGGGRDVTLFLRKQQAKLKTDIGRFNSLKLRSKTPGGLNAKEDRELDLLVIKLNEGYRGSGWRVIADGARSFEKQGKKVKILGKEVSPLAAEVGLNLFVGGYKLEKSVLAFQVGGAALGPLIGSTKLGVQLAKVATTFKTPLTFATFGLGGAIGIGEGIQRFEETDSVGAGIGAGLGASLGFLASVYSAELFTGGAKIIKKIRLPRGKKGSVSVFADEVVEVVYKGKVVKMTASEARRLGLTQRLTKNVLSDFLNKPVKSGKITRLPSFTDKAKRARLLLKEAKNTVEAKQAIVNLIKETYGDAFFADFIAQEGQGILGVLKPKPPKPVVDKLLGTETRVKPQTGGFGGDSVFTGSGQFERTGEFSGRLKGKAGGDLLSGTLLDFDTGQDLDRLTGLDSRIDTGLLRDSFTGLEFGRESEQDRRIDTSFARGLGSSQSPKFDTALNLNFGLASATAQDFGLDQAPALDFGRGRPTTRRPRTPKPKIPVPKIPIKIGFPRLSIKRKAKPLMGKKQAYDVFVKSKGVPRKVNRNPLTRINALNLGSNITDNTLSAQFSIKKTKKKAKPISFKIPQNYWSQSFPKFRGFKIKKGVSVPLKNTFIEKANRRLDTRSEVSQIGVSRYLKSLGRVGREFGKKKAKKKKRKTQNIGLKILTGF